MTLTEFAPAISPSTTPTAATPLLPVLGHVRVPVLGGRHRRYVNLDYAATAPALARVADRVERLLPYYASVHRGAGLPSQACTAAYERARSVVAAACRARPDDVVVFTRNTTDALTLLARSVPTGAGDVVFCDAEHHANLLPWRELPHRCLQVAQTLEQTLDRLSALLDAAPVALVAITGASNVTGEVLPIAEIVALARARGARVVVDAAQLAPHGGVDLDGWGADYVAFSGHKLYAPYGAGALVGRRDWLDAAAPYLPGGGAVREVRADGTDWASAPQRHEGGTPNLLGAVALATAMQELDTLAPGTLEAHEQALRDRLLDGLGAIPGVRILRTFADAPASIGLVTFTVDGRAAGEISAMLSAEHGIGVRDGRFCAHQLLARHGLPRGAVRASFGVGTTLADIDRLVDALARLVAHGPSARYVERDGAWAPEHDDRRFPSWFPQDDRDATTAPRPCERR